MSTGSPSRIRVETAAPYDVLVGHDLLGEIAAILGPGVRRVAVIHPESLDIARQAVSSLQSAGLDVLAIVIPDGEAAKTSSVVDQCWGALGRAGFTRSDAIVAVGGGAATDLAGFVAATFLRGLAVVHVPTTLLAMVDAAVGGKTGINTAEGKNLVGAFHEPAGVICDLDSLASLGRSDLVSGLAEVVKCGFIADPDILGLVEADPAMATEPTSSVLRELIERSIAVKARVVAGDLREETSQGSNIGREVLNYGHTLGHAIERAEHFGTRHGEAIAVGMVYVAELARLAGRLDASVVDRHRAVLSSVGLPTSYDRADWSDLLGAMRVDKKSRGDLMRFVILDDVARPAIVEDPDLDLLQAAYAQISAPRPATAG